MSNIPDAYLAAPHKHVSVEGGIFSGKGLLSSPLALFMVQATIIISLSRIIHRFLMPLRQPQVIAEIIGGMCLGPSIFGNIPGFTENIFPSSSLPTLNLIASFGLVLYMFLMGLELDTGLLFRGISKFLIIGTAGIILPGILGSIVSLGLYEFLLEPEKRDATPFSSFLLFTFAAFAITAFPVLARILTEKKLLSTSVGLMTISAAAMGDIFAWILLALVVSILNAGDPFTAFYVFLACTVYALLLLVPVRIAMKKLFEKFIRRRDHALTPIILAMIIMGIFLSAWTTEWIGVHAIFGAFLIGIIIPRIGGITMELTHKFEDLVGIIFLPLYFASSGLKTKLGVLNDWTAALFLILAILAATVGKVIGCMVGARITGFTWREAFSIGVLMNTKGLVELIVLNIGLDSGVINDKIFVIMVLMALFTTFVTSPIIAYVYPPKYHTTIQPVPAKKHKIKPAMTLNWPNADDKILIYLKDFDSVSKSASLVQLFKSSIASGKQMILHGLKVFSDFERSSNIMVGTQTEQSIENDPTLRMFKFFGELIGVFTKSFIATARLVEIGHEVNRISNNEQCDLIVVPWQKDMIGTDQQEATISILNEVHTTVAIFVDRRLPGAMTVLSQSFTGIVVPFTGCQGEREALKLACRFHNSANTKLTILHILFDGVLMLKIDQDLVQATKKMAKENEAVVFNEIRVENGDFSPVLETFRDPLYDLVILSHSIRIRPRSFIAAGMELTQTSIQKRTSIIRRFSQRSLTVSDEEKIFGPLGEMLYAAMGIPTMLVVHEPTSKTTDVA